MERTTKKASVNENGQSQLKNDEDSRVSCCVSGGSGAVYYLVTCFLFFSLCLESM